MSGWFVGFASPLSAETTYADVEDPQTAPAAPEPTNDNRGAEAASTGCGDDSGLDATPEPKKMATLSTVEASPVEEDEAPAVHSPRGRRKSTVVPKYVGLYVAEARFNLPTQVFPHKEIDLNIVSDGVLVSSSPRISLKSTIGGRSTVAVCELLTLLEYEQLRSPERIQPLSRRRSLNKRTGSYIEIVVSQTGEVFAQIGLAKDHLNGRLYGDEGLEKEGKSGTREFWLSTPLADTNAYTMIRLKSVCMVDKPNSGSSRISKDTFEKTSLSQCPEYDRYGISVQSSDTLQRASASWESFFDCENDFYRVEPWQKMDNLLLLRQQHPFGLLGQARAGVRNKQVLGHERVWRDNIWHCCVPQNMRMQVYLEVSGANRKRSKEAPSYFRRLCQRQATETDTMQIEVDLPRTFAGNKSFINTETGLNKLRVVLQAFSCRNRAIGYCQAMNYLVARLLMLGGDEEDAFWILCAICEDMFPGYWVPSMTGVQADLRVLEDLIHARLSRIALKIKRLEIPITGILSQYLLTLFLLTPSDVSFRLLDCILLEGGNALLVIAFAYFKIFETCLIEDAHDFDDFCTLLKKKVETYHDAPEILAVAYRELGIVGRETLSVARYNFRREFNLNAVFESRMRSRLKTKLGMPDADFEAAFLVFREAMERKKNTSHSKVKGEETNRELSVDYWGLDLQNFREVFLILMPIWENDLSAIDRLFVALDSTHSGVVDINEYMHGVQVLSSNSDSAKMRLIFEAYDSDDTNCMSKGELTSLLRSVYTLSQINLEGGALMASVEACISVVSETDEATSPSDEVTAEHGSNSSSTKDTTLSFDQFSRLASTQPLILKSFSMNIRSHK